MKRIKIEQIKVRLLPQSDPRMSGVHTSRIDRKEISRARDPGTESKSFVFNFWSVCGVLAWVHDRLLCDMVAAG